VTAPSARRSDAVAKAGLRIGPVRIGPVRIGIDGRELLGDTTGVGRYLGELMRRWTTRADADRRQFILYLPEALTADLTAELKVGTTLHPADLKVGGTIVRVIGKGAGTWWEQTALRRQVKADKPDVFFAPAYTAPLGIGMPLAVTIHDISFVAHPEWFRPREGLRRRLLTGRAAANASVIFTVSEFSRQEIETRLDADPGKIRVIAQGFTPPAVPQGGTRVPLVLFVGSLFNRRRLPDLITAFARATRDMPAARLAIVGGDRTWPPQDLPSVARELGVADRVELKRWVPDVELAGLYARASVFAFLSEYEGFGLTPLEALSAGVPIVVLDTPVAREVYGDAATYVSDVEGAAAALRRFLASPAEACALLARAPAVLARYSWDTAAAATLSEIERIAGRS